MAKPVKKPVRILQIVTVMNRAGLETMLMNYYRTIDRSKVQFDFLVHRPEEGDYDAEILKLGGKIYHTDPISLKNIGRYRKDLKNFFATHPKYQTVHAHLDALSALPLSVAKQAAIPTRIAHSHTSSFDKDAKFIVRNITKRFIKYYATDFLGCSKDAIEFMFGRNIANYTIINNAINSEVFTYNTKKRRAIRAELNIEDDQFVVGHVGRFNYPKNHNFLIDVFKKVHDGNKKAQLLLIGDGDGRHAIEQKVKDLKLSNAVRFLGVRPDIADLMQAMDTFVMPSHYEGLPVVSIEAQATGLPCYFSDVVTLDLDVTGNCQFISLDQSAEKWATSILKTNTKMRHNTNTAIIKNGYDVNIEAKKLEAFYTRNHA